MRLVFLGKVEYVGLNGEGRIYLILSKEKDELIPPICSEMKKFEGKDVSLIIKETRK